MSMKQTNQEKLSKSREILEQLREARGGTILEGHKKMGNDPHLVQMFLNQYRENKADCNIPDKYRELIVMAIGIVTGTETTVKVHSQLAVKKGADIDEIMEVLRIVFFTCGVTKLLPALDMGILDAIDMDEEAVNNE